MWRCLEVKGGSTLFLLKGKGILLWDWNSRLMPSPASQPALAAVCSLAPGCFHLGQVQMSRWTLCPLLRFLWGWHQGCSCSSSEAVDCTSLNESWLLWFSLFSNVLVRSLLSGLCAHGALAVSDGKCLVPHWYSFQVVLSVPVWDS